MATLFGKLLDKLLGKRHHPGWPRGVQPMVSGLAKVKAENPELWSEIANDPAYIGMAKLRERGLI